MGTATWPNGRDAVSTAERIHIDDLGRHIMDRVVTPDRIRESVEAITGPSIEIAAMRALPAWTGDLVVASARAEVLDIHVGRGPTDGERHAYDVTLAIGLSSVIRTAGVRHHFGGRLGLRFRLTVAFHDPLLLIVDAEPVGPEDIDIEMRPSGAAARVSQLVGRIDNEVRRHMAHTVNDQLNCEESLQHRRVDIRELVDEALG